MKLVKSMRKTKPGTPSQKQKYDFPSIDNISFSETEIMFMEASNEKIDIKTGLQSKTYQEITSSQHLSHLEKLFLLKQIVESQIIKHAPTPRKKRSPSNTSDFDGYTPEFNEDGECIAGEEWDYPGSPYLSEDDDIY